MCIGRIFQFGWCISGEPRAILFYLALFQEPGLIVWQSSRFSPTKLSQTEFLTNKGINSYLFTEGALDFLPNKRNLLLILEISHQPVGEKWHSI